MDGREREDISTNVLIIGKTGVGKSSFINYLYPKARRATGAGRPVTGRGIYRSVMKTENGLSVNLYDTWGLEASHSAEWKKIIVDEARRHDADSIRDWFHTIIYCLSAKSARVERFESEQINALRAEGNSVMAVLTHCDLYNVNSAIEKMSEILVGECGLSDDDIARVASVNKTLLGGASAGPFGRERVIERMVSDLWRGIAEKIPPILARRGKDMIEKWRGESDAIIDREINFFNRLSNDAIKSVLAKINRRAKDCRENFSSLVEATLRDALGYYRVFAEKYSELATDGFGLAAKDLGRFSSALERELTEAKVIDVIAYLIFPVALPFAAEIRRDELKESLDGYEDRMRGWIESYAEEVALRLSGGAEKPAGALEAAEAG
jgi:GTP-binding protein EngB required for normal cell division